MCRHVNSTLNQTSSYLGSIFELLYIILQLCTFGTITCFLVHRTPKLSGRHEGESHMFKGDKSNRCNWPWSSQPPPIIYDNVLFLIPAHIQVCHSCARRARLAMNCDLCHVCWKIVFYFDILTLHFTIELMNCCVCAGCSKESTVFPTEKGLVLPFMAMCVLCSWRDVTWLLHQKMQSCAAFRELCLSHLPFSPPPVRQNIRTAVWSYIWQCEICQT